MNMDEKMLRLLKTVSYFADLAPTVRADLANCSQCKSLRAGQFVFMAGDLCQHLYILESGRVKFYGMNAEGREQVLKVLNSSGDIFCIPAVFLTGKHIVSASVVTETRLRLLNVDTVNRLMQEHPSMALKLVTTAAEHITHLVALAEDLSLKTATARLAKYLCELAVAEGAENGKEVRISRNRLPEEELASLLGTVRVHISRSLVNLVQAGTIDLTRTFIRVRDLTALKRISEGKEYKH